MIPWAVFPDWRAPRPAASFLCSRVRIFLRDAHTLCHRETLPRPQRHYSTQRASQLDASSSRHRSDSIILLPEFCDALERVQAAHNTFLMVGRRWDVDILQLVDFREPGAGDRLRQLALQSGVRRGPDAVDYFAFRRGLYSEIPPLVVGRVWWDHWLVWKARQLRADVVDVSSQVIAIHQNHSYGYHPAGAKGVWNDKQAVRNYELAGGKWHLYTIADATHILESSGDRRNWGRFLAPYVRVLRPKLIPLWFALLDLTRPVRKLLGLRRPGIEPHRD